MTTIDPQLRALCVRHGGDLAANSSDLETALATYQRIGPLTAADRAELDGKLSSARVGWLADRYGNDAVRVAHIDYFHGKGYYALQPSEAAASVALDRDPDGGTFTTDPLPPTTDNESETS